MTVSAAVFSVAFFFVSLTVVPSFRECCCSFPGAVSDPVGRSDKPGKFLNFR